MTDISQTTGSEESDGINEKQDSTLPHFYIDADPVNANWIQIMRRKRESERSGHPSCADESHHNEMDMPDESGRGLPQ